MKVIDNFLPDRIFNKLQEGMMSNLFSWYWADEKVPENNSYRNCQLVHTLYENNTSYSDWDVSPVTSQLKVKAIHRIKANLTLYTPEIYEYGLHTDVNFPCYTAVYYLNTNDGYTIFEDGAKVESVANRILIFDSMKMHTGTTCTNEKRRVVLNLNFF